MKDYPWNENDRSARCRVRRAGVTYCLYAGDLPDICRAVWFIRQGKRVIASGIADNMGKALAQVEHALEKWTSRDWRVYG